MHRGIYYEKIIGEASDITCFAPTVEVHVGFKANFRRRKTEISRASDCIF